MSGFNLNKNYLSTRPDETASVTGGEDNALKIKTAQFVFRKKNVCLALLRSNTKLTLLSESTANEPN